MKLLTTLSSVLIISTLLICSADNLKAQISIGPQIGISHSSFSLDNRDDILSRENSMTAGVFANIELGEWLSIQPEASYVRLGGMIGDNNESRSYRIHYLTIPVLAKLSFPIAGEFYPNIAVGPYVSSKLEANYKYHSALLPNEIDLSDQVRKWDYGAVASLGLDFRGDHFLFGIDVRYSLGLANISEDSSVEYYQKAKSGSIAAFLRAGYRF